MKIWEKLPDLTKKVNQDHHSYGLVADGHDFDHDLRVAQMAVVISPNEQVALLAGAAGLCHSADHIGEKRFDRKENVANTTLIIEEWLKFTNFNKQEKEEITSAVLAHRSKNQLADSLVKIALCDADRLVNMEPDVIIRAGQFHPDLLAIDPIQLQQDPEASFQDPKSVFWLIKNCLSWIEAEGPYVLRLPKARELGQERAAFLHLFMIKTIDFRRKLITPEDYSDLKINE